MHTVYFFSSRRRHTRFDCDWSSDVCSSDLRREAIAKAKLKKNDIAQVFEAIAIAHGVIGICAPEELVLQNLRNLYITALRDEEEDRSAGLYRVDLDRMTFRDTDYQEDTNDGVAEGATVLKTASGETHSRTNWP